MDVKLMKTFLKGLNVKYSHDIKFLILTIFALFLSPLIFFIGYLFVMSCYGFMIGAFTFNESEFFPDYLFLYYLHSGITILASMTVYAILLHSLVTYKTQAKKIIFFKIRVSNWCSNVVNHGTKHKKCNLKDKLDNQP